MMRMKPGGSNQHKGKSIVKVLSVFQVNNNLQALSFVCKGGYRSYSEWLDNIFFPSRKPLLVHIGFDIVIGGASPELVLFLLGWCD